MPDTLVYIGYAVTVIVVVLLSFKLGKYVDIIDAKSKISGAFIGGVMLAAVTSLPELFTSLSSVWIVRESSSSAISSVPILSTSRSSALYCSCSRAG